MKQMYNSALDASQRFMDKKYNRSKIIFIIIYSAIDWITSTETENILSILPPELISKDVAYIFVYSGMFGVFMAPWIIGMLITFIFYIYLYFKKIKRNFLDVWINCCFIVVFIFLASYILGFFFYGFYNIF